MPAASPAPLAGAAVIVTGASSGNGAATALAFAEAGAHLTLVARRQQHLEDVARRVRAHGVEALVRPMDVADRAAAEACVADTRERFGRLDVVAYCAGMNTPRRNLRDLEPEEWRRVMDVNLDGAYYFTRAALPSLRAAGGGSIVIVGSIGGLVADEGGGVAYCASKFGVTALAQSINSEERRHGIRACAIQAGEVDTPLLEHRAAPPPAELRPLMLRSEDVAAAILYAASQPRWVNVEEIVILPTLDRDYPGARELAARWQRGQ
jgi:NADP-dependent 3-hydroxy acid dehydrogenase YdfG